jgi:hypothetical protein
MPIRRSGSLDDVTGFDVLRQCRSATVVDIYYEEHTPVAAPGSRRLTQLGHWAAAREQLDSTESEVSTQLATATQLRDSEAQPTAAVLRARLPRPASLPPPIPPRASASRPPMAAVARSSSPPPPPPTRNTERLVLPPALVRTSSISRPDALLPEMAHDPHYYPGLVPAAHERGESEAEPAARRPMPKWLWHALAGVTLFAAGLAVASLRSSPESSVAPIQSKPVETRNQAARTTSASATTAPVATDDAASAVTAPADAIAAKPMESAAAPLSAHELAKQRRAERRAAKVANRYLSRKTRTGHGLNADPSGGQPAATSDMAAPAEARTASAASNGAKTGTLQINSRPWADVYVDNKPVGHTPQMGLQLSPGHHTVKLTNPTMGMSKTLSVTIRAGETVKKIETLGG